MLCVYILVECKGVRVVVDLFCENLVFDVEDVIIDFGVGEVLVLMFDEKGVLSVV